MSRVILYSGSFNPVHRGHTSIAEYILEHKIADRVWFVVSPQNPFKNIDSLAAETQRLDMARLAISESRFADQIEVSDIELTMPRPSRTIDTIDRLRKEHPDSEFSLLIGSDNVSELHLWKEADRLVNSTKIYVYPRRDYDWQDGRYTNRLTLLEDVELLDFTATDIRIALTDCGSYQTLCNMMGRAVTDYIIDNGMYGCQSERLLSDLVDTEQGDRKISALMRRAKSYMKQQRHADALNDYNAVLEMDSENREARQYCDMINEILEFRYKDIYNP